VSAAGPGVPAGPLESAPGGFVPGEERSAILAGVLDGVELGGWDLRVVGWVAAESLDAEQAPVGGKADAANDALTTGGNGDLIGI
jgi:hypothetical protein